MRRGVYLIKGHFVNIGIYQEDHQNIHLAYSVDLEHIRTNSLARSIA